jgi:hypothetical protein
MEKHVCETNDVLLQDPFDSLCGKPQSVLAPRLKKETNKFGEPVSNPGGPMFQHLLVNLRPNN